MVSAIRRERNPTALIALLKLSAKLLNLIVVTRESALTIFSLMIKPIRTSACCKAPSSCKALLVVIIIRSRSWDNEQGNNNKRDKHGLTLCCQIIYCCYLQKNHIAPTTHQIHPTVASSCPRGSRINSNPHPCRTSGKPFYRCWPCPISKSH